MKTKGYQQQCLECRFFTDEYTDESSDVGHCVRYPPRIVGEFEKYMTPHKLAEITEFPATSYVSWCGEWQADSE